MGCSDDILIGGLSLLLKKNPDVPYSTNGIFVHRFFTSPLPSGTSYHVQFSSTGFLPPRSHQRKENQRGE
jgi:hypothetical protein